MSPVPGVRCLISTGVSATVVSPLVELVEDPHQRAGEDPEDDRRHHGRQVDRAERRQDATEEPDVRLAHVVEEALEPREPGRIRQPHPARQDVQEDDERVDGRERPDEAVRLVDRVRTQGEAGCRAHPKALRRRGDFSYAWLKKPPRSSIRARSSADTSTLRGVSRNTLSATRCMPPSSAYVSPLAKSMRRFERSWSEPCRLRITGTPSLKRSAICWASLKLRGRTRCTLTEGLGIDSTPRSRRGSAAGRSTLVRAADGSGSVQSSNSSRRRRGASRRTFGRSAYARCSSSSVR